MSGAFTKTVRLDFENDRMVNEAVNGGDGHHGITKDGVPLTERLIGSDHDAFALIAVGNEFKENGGFCLGFLDIAEVINDHEVKAVELFQGRLKLEMKLFFLEMLDQGGGTEEFDALARFQGGTSDASGQMGFADPRRSEEETVLGVINPLGFSGEFLNRERVNQGQVCPIEIGNRFGVGQLSFGDGSLEAQSLAAVCFELAQGQEKLRVGPGLSHGLLLQGLPVVEHMG